MTTRPYELLARFANDGSIAGVSVRTITTVNGRDYEGDPQPLSGATDPAFSAFAAAFSAAIVAQRDQLLTDKSALETQLTTLTSERDALQSQVNQLTAQNADLTSQGEALAEAIATVTGERDSLTQELVTVTSDRDAKAQRVIELEAQLEALLHPPGPDLTTRDGVEQYISNTRYARETGGITISGQRVSTERDEIGQWLARYASAAKWLAGDPQTRTHNPSGMYPYKPKGGPPAALSAAQVIRAFELGQTYINNCFASELALYLRLESGDESLSDIVAAADDASTWPVSSFAW